MRKIRLFVLLLVAVLLADTGYAQCPSFSRRNNGNGGTCSPADIGNIPAGKIHTGRFTFTSASPSTDLILTKVLLNGNLLQQGSTVYIGTIWFGNYNGASKDLCFYGIGNTDNATPAGNWRLFFTNPATGASFVCSYFIDADGNPSTFLPGTIGSDATLCTVNTPSTLTSSVAATGATGTVAYQWQQSTTSPISGFTNIPGATSATYTPGPLAQTTYFQRLAYDVVGGVNVVTMSSNVVTLTVVACQDADSDGVDDASDLDDDNDGVLDHIESPNCFITANEWNSIDKQPYVTVSSELTAVAATSDFTKLVDNDNAVNAVQFSTSPNQSQLGKTIFEVEFPRPIQLASWYITKASSTQIINGSVMLQGSNDRGTWTNLWTTAANPANATNVTANGGLSLTNSNKYAVSINAAPYRYYRIRGTTNSNVLAGIAREFYFDVNTTVYNPSLFQKDGTCSDDADGDGTPNYLDSDSDGDGCPDAVEAGTVNNLIASTVAGPYGNNGFANSLETTTESGVYAGTYTYAYATNDQVNLCNDSDGDGVNDFNDLDDDNDGILDCTEGFNGVFDLTGANLGFVNRSMEPSGFIKFSGAKTTTGQEFGPPGGDANGNLWQSANLGAGNKAIYQLDFTRPVNFEIRNGQGPGGGGYITAEENHWFTTDGPPIFLSDPSNQLQIWNGTAWVAVPANYSSNLIKWRLAAGTLLYGQGNFVFTATNVSSLNWTYINQSAVTANAATLNFKAKCGDIDSDGDGIPNRLDTDSDGDGCPDANEYYASATAAGTDGNSYYGNGNPPAVNANGTVVGASYTGSYTAAISQSTPATISAQPVSVSAFAGDTKTFSVTVTPGSSAPTYQWQVSSDNGQTWSNVTNGGVYSGATTNTLTLTGITSGILGNYYRVQIAQADMACIVAISNVAILSNGTNQPPVAVDDTNTTPEDTPVSGNVLTNDTDTEGNPLSVTQFAVGGQTYNPGQTATIPGVGTLVINANGTYTFTPAPNYNGPVPTATYTVGDNQGGTDTGTLNLSVTPVNDAPVANNDQAVTTEDTPVSGNVLSNDTDVDGNPLSVTQFTINGQTYTAGQTATIPGVGTLVINADGSYTFTPALNYNGPVPTATYTVSDGQGGTDTADLSLNVLAVNDPPVGVNDTGTTPENTPKSGNVLFNDTDPENDDLSVIQFTIAGVSGTFTAGQTATIPGVGTLVINANGSYTFTPVAGYVGSVPVATYTLSDTQGETSTATLSLTVTSTVTDTDGDGIPDSIEGTGDTDGDGTPDYLDLDSDGDGIPDSIEDNGCTGTAPCTPTDTDGDGTPDYLDLDSDNDGIPDSLEDAGCNGTAPCTPTDTDGDGTPNYLDLDSDGDGIPDSIEDAGCNGTAPCTPTDTDGDGTPNYLDLDSDGDGIPDSEEDAGCTGTAPCIPTDTDGDGTPNYLDLDSDNDGIPDSLEDSGCTGTAPCTPTDTDGDGTPNYLDLDSDGDGIPDSVEDAGCNGTAPCTPTDTDGDGTPNYLDLDSDNDGIPDSLEDAGCNGTAPCTPTDTDGDGTPNYLDLDSDNDGIPDSIEDAGCNGTAPCTPTDTDNDGTPDYLDLDSDNDGIPDSLEDAGCNGTAPCTPTDTDGDGTPNYLDLDSDNDGIPDSIEDAGCNGTAPCTPTDTDGDGTPNYLDLDSDNDGIPDSIEDNGCTGTAPCTPTDTDNDGTPDYLDIDSDNDGIPDSIEDAGCNGTAPCTPTDSDGDGVPNYLDLDSDNDGILDSVEDSGCTGTAPCTPTDTDNDGIPNYLDLDSDGDGCSDANEAYNSLTAQGTDGNQAYGNGNPPTVNSSGQVVGATYPAPGTGYITAGAAPVISTDPTNQQVALGGNTSFQVSASVSTGLVSYQWQVSTNGGSTWSDLSNGSPYSGVTTATLTLTSVPGTLQGAKYRVIAYQVGFICGADTSSAATLTVNFPPVANNDVVSTPEDQPATGNVLTNDTDANGDPLSVTDFTINGVTYPAGTTATIPGVGTLVINPNGTFTFTPAPNYNGPVPTATYTISDGQGGTDTANLNITVTPSNDAPVANDDSATTPEDTPVSGNVLTNDTDVDGNPLTVTQFVINGQVYTAGTLATIPGVGTLVINSNGTYTFTPVPNYNGPVPTATYTVSDGQGGTDTAGLNITVTPVNDVPVANDDVNTTPEDTPVSGNVLTNDTDADGNPLTVTQFTIAGVTGTFTAGQTATIPGVGTLVINANGTYTFTPAPNYNGAVPTATYTVSDGQGGTDTANLNITVTPVNDAPVANDDVNTTPEDTPVSGNVLTNDTDVDGNPLTVTQFVINGQVYTAGTLATIPGVGTLVINSNGTYTFTPAPNYNGQMPTATYTVSDGQGGTDTAALNITVTPVNDAPVANDDVNTTPEDTPVSGNVLTNDTDVDGNPLTVTQFTIAGVTGTFTAGQTATIPGVGTLVINANGTYTFTPALNYNGPVPAATYTVSDGQGGTDTALLQITITPVNDAPVANDDTATTPEDTPVSGNVLTNDTDVDGDPLTVTQFTIQGLSGTFTAGQTATIPGVGTLVINANGTYTFTPAPNFNGPVPPVTYTVSDGQGGTATATLNITVQAVGDPEDITITTTAVCERGPVTLTASSTTVASPVFRWYAEPLMTTLLFTGATYVTPAITNTTTYYVSVSGTGVLPNQPGNGKTAVAVILPAPARPTIGANGPLTFCKDDSVTLDAGLATTYQWYKNGTAISGATQRTYVAKDQGDYTVVVTNSSGCPSQPSSPALVRVPCVKGIHMPTVFTPNKDGVNDTVKPSVPGMKKFQCYKIYNRWGNLVFDNQGVLQGWDGTFKGVNQPADTYLWIVLGEDGAGKPMRATGQITLIR